MKWWSLSKATKSLHRIQLIHISMMMAKNKASFPVIHYAMIWKSTFLLKDLKVDWFFSLKKIPYNLNQSRLNCNQNIILIIIYQKVCQNLNFLKTEKNKKKICLRLEYLATIQQTLPHHKSEVSKKLGPTKIVLYQKPHCLMVAKNCCLQKWRLFKSLRVVNFLH